MNAIYYDAKEKHTLENKFKLIVRNASGLNAISTAGYP